MSYFVMVFIVAGQMQFQGTTSTNEIMRLYTDRWQCENDIPLKYPGRNVVCMQVATTR